MRFSRHNENSVNHPVHRYDDARVGKRCVYGKKRQGCIVDVLKWDNGMVEFEIDGDDGELVVAMAEEVKIIPL